MRLGPATWAASRAFLLFALLAPGTASSARAQADPVLFLVDSQFSPPLTRVFRLDPATGTLELRADLGEAYTPVLGMAAGSGTVLYLAGTDTGPGDLCQGNVACLLLRVELDPLSPVPAAVQVVGTFTEEGSVQAGITGLTFRQDGNLYAISQDTNGLYLLDPLTAALTRIGTVDLTLHGGDITFDGSDRLWLWSNIGAGDGLYQIDPLTAHASLFDPQPFLDMSGLAAVGHGNTLQGVSPLDDRSYEIDPAIGLTGVSVPLSLEGVRFDHRRGDLDSPFCRDDEACADGNDCTSDECSPGGCRHPALPDGTACDDSDACTRADGCLSGACSGADPVICVAPDPCHDPGTCNPATGLCENAPALPDGTPCDDSDACTQVDSCQSGTCAGSGPVVCGSPDACHGPGTCDPATGLCEDPPALPDGTPCEDSDPCTLGDACQSGTCQPGVLLDLDRDGYAGAVCGGGDCDDADPSVFPGAPQVCDSVNNDCLAPGWPALAGTNEADDDGDTLSECQGDCDDADPATYPDAPEANDGLDNQCPGNPGFGSIDEISGLSGFGDPGDPSRFCWPVQSGAVQYEVVRSDDVSFPHGCAGAMQPAVCWSDAPAPPPGSVHYFLVRAVSPHVGSWGKQSSGKERTGICPGGPVLPRDPRSPPRISGTGGSSISPCNRTLPHASYRKGTRREGTLRAGTLEEDRRVWLQACREHGPSISERSGIGSRPPRPP